jgi:hypothetical protein
MSCSDYFEYCTKWSTVGCSRSEVALVPILSEPWQPRQAADSRDIKHQTIFLHFYLIYLNIFPQCQWHSVSSSLCRLLQPASFAEKSPSFPPPALPLPSPAPVSTPWAHGQCQGADGFENRVLSFDSASSEEVCASCISPRTSPMLLSKLGKQQELELVWKISRQTHFGKL